MWHKKAMIRYDNKLWFRHITSFRKTDTLRVLLPEILVIGIYSAGLTYLVTNYLDELANLQKALSVHSLIGFVLSLLLVFRTNSAYDKWWEGRKHWGALINNTRNLAINLKVLVPTQKESLAFYQRMIPNYAFALKEHLKDNRILTELDLKEGEKGWAEKCDHLPNKIAESLYKETLKLNKDGHITNEDMIRLDNELRALTDITGACERIKNTPIPYSYSLFLKKFIFIYIITLPLGLIPDFSYWTVPLVCFFFYVLLSLELIAEEIEEPFGYDDNDLPTGDMSQKIKVNVAEIMED